MDFKYNFMISIVVTPYHVMFNEISEFVTMSVLCIILKASSTSGEHRLETPGPALDGPSPSSSEISQIPRSCRQDSQVESEI